MNMFIKFNGDVNIINPNDGNTALHYAMLNENKEALYILLSKGNCDLSIKNHNNETAIDLAKKMNNESNKEIYELFMKFIDSGKPENNNGNKNNNYSNKKEKKINTNNDNDKMFMFPPKGDISSRIEFPFSFQNKSILNNNEADLSNSSNSLNNNNINNFDNLNQLSSLIKMENTPILYLDISDEPHQNNLIYDSLKTESKNLDKTLESKQDKLINFKNENENLINELNKLKNDLLLKNQEINILNEQKTQEENKFIYQRQLNQAQIEQKDMAIQSLLINLKELEKEITDINKGNKENNINDNTGENNNDINNVDGDDNKNTGDKKEIEIDTKKFKYIEKK